MVMSPVFVKMLPTVRLLPEATVRTEVVPTVRLLMDAAILTVGWLGAVARSEI
jgi:hypothetical protein